MKILFKCIFFTLLFFKIFNANASNYIYSVNYVTSSDPSAPDISVCNINPSDGNIRKCKSIWTSHYAMEGTVIADIATSPDGAYVYIVKREGSRFFFYTCLINNNKGDFQHCTSHRIVDHGTPVITATNDSLYIVFTEDSGVNHKSKIMMCSNKTSECNTFDQNFEGVKHITISSDNKYAYLISKKNVDHRAQYKFYACPIQKDGTFDHNSCHITDLNLEKTLGLSDIAITKDNRAIYLVLARDRDHPQEVPIKYCLIDSESLGNCTDSKVQLAAGYHLTYLEEPKPVKILLNNISIYPEFQPIQIILDNIGKYAYILHRHSFTIDNVLKCEIADTGFENCIPDTTMENHFAKPGKLAYRRNEEAPITLKFFGPKV